MYNINNKQLQCLDVLAKKCKHINNCKTKFLQVGNERKTECQSAVATNKLHWYYWHSYFSCRHFNCYTKKGSSRQFKVTMISFSQKSRAKEEKMVKQLHHFLLITLQQCNELVQKVWSKTVTIYGLPNVIVWRQSLPKTLCNFSLSTIAHSFIHEPNFRQHQLEKQNLLFCVGIRRPHIIVR